MKDMLTERIVVGASGDDEASRTTARRLRDEGHEVVFVGGRQSPEHLVRTAIAEDATRIVVDADQAMLERVIVLCKECGVGGTLSVTLM